MSGSSFDCYLCGTSNDADADVCAKCNGQLLKLGALDDEHVDDAETTGDGVDELALMSDFEDQPEQEAETSAPAKTKNPMRKRLSRSIHTSVEDRRLSDALGLSDEPGEGASLDGLKGLDTEVTSIPRARPAENIPVLGTRTVAPGSRTQFVDDDRISKISYVALAVLIVVTGWFGYNALLGGGNSEPTNIAFAEATTTLAPTTTTTEAPDEGLTLAQVDFIYGAAVVRIVPYSCTADETGAIGDPMTGIAINDRSVLLPPNLPAETTAVQIVTRTGSTRVGLVSTTAGLPIATSDVLTTRNLAIENTASDADFYVGYDLASNAVSTTESPQSLDAEISVTKTGALHEVRIGSRVTPGAVLAGIDLTVDVDPEGGSRRRGGLCSRAGRLIFETPIVEENEIDAGSEETDAG